MSEPKIEIEAQDLQASDIGRRCLIEFEDEGLVSGYLTSIKFDSLHRATLTKDYEVVDLEITRRTVLLEVDGVADVELEADDCLWIDRDAAARQSDEPQSTTTEWGVRRDADSAIHSEKAARETVQRQRKRKLNAFLIKRQVGPWELAEPE